MQRKPATKERGLQIARKLRQRLKEEGVPIIDVMLFGSLVNGKPHEWSDVDIAVVYRPFKEEIMQERRAIRRLQEDHDVPVDVLCFRPEDLENKLWGVAQEVKKHGMSV